MVLESAKLMYTLNYHLRQIGKQMNICEENNTVSEEIAV